MISRSGKLHGFKREVIILLNDAALKYLYRALWSVENVQFEFTWTTS